AGVGRRVVVATPLQPLVPHARAVAVPIKHLNAIGFTIEEDKQVARHGVGMELGPYQRRQAIGAAAQVGRRGGAPNRNRGRQRQHGTTPSKGSSWRNQARSQSGARRRTQPEGRTSSRAAPVGAATRRTGTKRGASVWAGAGPCWRRRRQA